MVQKGLTRGSEFDELGRGLQELTKTSRSSFHFFEQKLTKKTIGRGKRGQIPDKEVMLGVEKGWEEPELLLPPKKLKGERVGQKP